MEAEYLKREADRVSIIFYCLYTENVQLKAQDELDVVTQCAEQMEVDHFAFRSGDVQDPKILLEELESYESMLNYTIILIDVQTRKVKRLSDKQIQRVLDVLKNYTGDQNSGAIVKMAIET